MDYITLRNDIYFNAALKLANHDVFAEKNAVLRNADGM